MRHPHCPRCRRAKGATRHRAEGAEGARRLRRSHRRAAGARRVWHSRCRPRRLRSKGAKGTRRPRRSCRLNSCRSEGSRSRRRRSRWSKGSVSAAPPMSPPCRESKQSAPSASPDLLETRRSEGSASAAPFTSSRRLRENEGSASSRCPRLCSAAGVKARSPPSRPCVLVCGGLFQGPSRPGRPAHSPAFFLVFCLVFYSLEEGFVFEDTTDGQTNGRTDASFFSNAKAR